MAKVCNREEALAGNLLYDGLWLTSSPLGFGRGGLRYRTTPQIAPMDGAREPRGIGEFWLRDLGSNQGRAD